MRGSRMGSAWAEDLGLEDLLSYEPRSSEVGGEVEAVERSPLRKRDSDEDEIES